MARRTILERFRDALEITLRRLPEYDGHIRVVRNRDRTIDAELTIPVPWGVKPRKVINDLEEAAHIPQGAWMSVGVRLEPSGFERVVPEEDWEKYNRIRGMVDVATHYTSGVNKGTNFEHARAIERSITRSSKRFNKPKEVIMRLHHKGRKKPPRYRRGGE